MKRYAARIIVGVVQREVVCLGDVVDVAAECARLGYTGDWVDAEGVNRRAAPGMHMWDGGFYARWRQIAGADLGPDGAESGYPEGAEVWHAGEVWVSTVDNNVWEPGVSGWQRRGEPDAPPPWQQPTGAHDAYAAGARATHNGRVWINTHGDGNVWEPGVFGWQDEGPA